MIANAVAALGAWAWIVLGLALIGIELLAPGAFFLWLGLAALVTGILDAGLGLSWQTATLVFAGLAVAAVLIGRSLGGTQARGAAEARSLNRRGEILVGRVFVLEAALAGGEGRLRVDDSSWRITGPDAPPGARVRVVRVDGATLVVEPV
jgi:membrane protein implicated in regulation of membrane protease activity